MRAALLAFLAGALAIVGPGCSQQPLTVSARAFNRPSRVTFVCLEGQTPTALAECAPEEDGTQRDGFTLIALVPQQTRGEVAAVDMSSDPPRVLDSDRRVPGYTFVPVGEIPTAIAISPTSPRCTWVANRGSRDLSAVETVRFREESLAEQEVAETLSLLDGTGLASGRPHAMELIETGGATELFVTLPEDAAIARVTVSATDCTFGAIEIIPVPTDVPLEPAGAPTDPTLRPPAEQDPATLALCPESTALPLLASVPPAVTLEAIDPAALPPPAPLELIVEREGDVAIALYVGDAARPVVHRFDLATATFDGSLRAAGPVRDLALTPAVPDSLADGAPTRRYLYAIDERDGTVFVIDVSTGHVLPVGGETSRRVDRLPFRATARAIEVISTDDERRTACESDPAIEPSLLRGVFVAVALSDGSVRFVDVLDLDADCRAGMNCNERFGLNEVMSFVGRHRPRLSRIPEPVQLEGTPVANVGGSSLRYEGNGQVEIETSTPILSELPEGCPPGLGGVYPESGAPRICVVTDPWTAELETWQVTWQGAIPGTASTGGNFEVLPDGRLAIDTRIDLCARGVLGADGAAATPEGEPESGIPGDAVAITSALPEASEGDAGCRALVGIDSGDEALPVLLPIAEIALAPGGGSRIVVAADAPVLERGALGVADVIRCFAPSPDSEELVSFDARVRESYTVVGQRTGFQHRVVRVGETCQVDVTQDVRLQGRALVNRPFASERTAFFPTYPADVAIRPEITISWTVTDAPVQLATNLAAPGGATTLTLPSELVWSPLDERLYVIDETRRGLVPVLVQPVTPQRAIE